MTKNFISDFPMRIYALSEKSVTIEFGDSIREDLSDTISEFNKIIVQNPFSGLTSTVPGYSTLSIFYNPVLVKKSNLSGETCFEKVSSYINLLSLTEKTDSSFVSDKVIIPVLYGGDFGQDISQVASKNNLREEEVIALHTSIEYRVFMIGFVPGFAYLGGMDKRISTPRKLFPNPKIAAGSVGIAGEQTGIYPMETPGGWQIIGRTPFKMFDANRDSPALLKAGDTVVFKSINADEFNDLANL
ncbi:5-oxoprolinase subunit PxpB [Pedobacter jamesrossensis]|uniref:5-oxoprolinase subunit PxpB n=1 Tax=Pedobacter jamesrossensis TaxID=1908238 RepID=A0ABV8NNT9_9SPHI